MLSKTLSQKLVSLMYLVGIIMYVGGILSHIVIPNVLGTTDLYAIYYTAVYKQQSAYILILPGLVLKLLATLIESREYKQKPLWLKVQYACMAFLTVNAFVFLVPMMPEMTELAARNLDLGIISDSYQAHAEKEMIIGISNALPLLVMVILSAVGTKPHSKICSTSINQ
ncbi:enoyl-CoA hydratase [Photobacterium sp. SDRW27]|uniref:enoyl-CoA hydratase n=1 Tax=Photobacterium obscurum TaxID=2829490 RepID=UPI002244522A|nr:enoyl-CoA hydratase [Photobacterium obscurum]MCW8330959.1 enoyl-CoA hydratase [Photobacterium obscurum]